MWKLDIKFTSLWPISTLGNPKDILDEKPGSLKAFL